MKPKFVPILSAATLLAATVSTKAATVTWDNGAGDNNWASGLNWSGNVVPNKTSPADASVLALVNSGFLANVSSAVPQIATLRIGNTSAGGIVDIQTGGFLTATTGTQIASGNTSNGTLKISGGTFSAASLQVASNNATATLGLVDVTAGTFTWTSGNVGSAGTGRINVTGDTATVSGTNLTLGSGGGLGFTFNSTGVSKISLAGLFSINAASTLNIDMLNYLGGTANFDLADTAATLTGSFGSGNITVAKTAGYDAVVVQDSPTGLVYLQITAIPEPSIAGLAGVFGLLMLVRRRR